MAEATFFAEIAALNDATIQSSNSKDIKQYVDMTHEELVAEAEAEEFQVMTEMAQKTEAFIEGCLRMRSLTLHARKRQADVRRRFERTVNLTFVNWMHEHFDRANIRETVKGLYGVNWKKVRTKPTKLFSKKGTVPRWKLRRWWEIMTAPHYNHVANYERLETNMEVLFGDD